MTLTFTTNTQSAGKTVYTILRRELSVSASLLRRLKQCNGIFVNRNPVYTNYVLQNGDILTADVSKAEPICDIVPESGKLHILFENDGFVAVNKEPGIIVHPSHSRYGGTLANFISGYLLKQYGDGRCHAVNRLDRDTSGVVLFAKNSYIKDRLSKALQMECAKKEYCAIVCGTFNAPSGMIELPIRRKQEGNILRITAPDGQRAVTHYKTEQILTRCGETISVIRLYLETGRTHQIRVHCLASGHPVLGDTLYNTDISRSLSEKLHISMQALHACSLTFIDPISGKKLTISAPIIRQDMNLILR